MENHLYFILKQFKTRMLKGTGERLLKLNKTADVLHRYLISCFPYTQINEHRYGYVNNDASGNLRLIVIQSN